MFDSRKKGFEILACYNDILSCPFGIHTSLTAGIPSYRIVWMNTEAKNISESITDNGTVGFGATTDAVARVAGIVKDGCGTAYSDLDLLPQTNRDFNVTVTVLGTMLVEVLAGEVITPGDNLGDDAEGRATAEGNGVNGATGLIAMSGTTGVGTVDNPEFVVTLVR